MIAEFKRIYDEAVDLVIGRFTPQMQNEIALHNNGWRVGRTDFRRYLEASAERYFRPYFALQHAAIVGMIVFSKMSALEDSAHKLRLIERTVLGLAGIMLIGGLLAGILADPVIVLLYGEAFRPAVRIFLFLIPAVFALSLNQVYQNYFASIGFPLIAVASPIAGALLNLGLNAILLPSIGVIGAALASIAAYSFMLLCSLFYVYVLGRKKRMRAGEDSK